MRIEVDFLDDVFRESFSRNCNQIHKLQSDLGYHSADSALIYPYRTDNWRILGGVRKKDGSFMLESTVQNADYGVQGYDEYNITDVDDSVIFIGCLHRCWGHQLTDNLKKLWFLYSYIGKDLIQSGAKIYYSILPDNPLSDSNWRLLQLAGFDKESFNTVEGILRCKTVYVPDDSFLSNNGSFERAYSWSFEQLNIYELIRKNAKSNIQCYDKIYFSRCKWEVGKRV